MVALRAAASETNSHLSVPPGLEQPSPMPPPGLEMPSSGVSSTDVAALALRNAQLKEEIARLQLLALERQSSRAACNLAGAHGGLATWPEAISWNQWPTFLVVVDPSQPKEDVIVLEEESTNCGSSHSEEDVVVVEEDKTSVIVKELPVEFTRDMLVELLERHGFAGQYDFIYVPHNFRQERSFGYAFVNFVNEEIGESFLDKFDGFSEWGVESDKRATVQWAESNQGLSVHIARYRNSPTMHESVLDGFKPAVYQNGERVPFPPPTKTVKAPRLRR